MKRRRFIIVTLIVALYAHLFIMLVEVEKHHERATIKTLEDAAWYVMVTLTTVGYGDVYPVTRAGKIIGAVFLVSSIGVIGLFIGLVSTSIHEFREKRKMGLNGTSFRNHVVILGWNGFAEAVVGCLIAAGRQVAVITNSKEDIDSIYETFSHKYVFVLCAHHEHTPTFEKANIRHALLVFVNLPNDADKLITLINIRQAYPGTRFLVVLDEPKLTDTFYGAGVTYVLSKNDIAAKLVASYIFEPDVAHFNSDLLSHALTSSDYDVQEYKILRQNVFAGKPFGNLFSVMRAQYGCLTIGLVKVRENERLLLKLPPDDTIVESGDYAIFIVNGEQATAVEELFSVKEGVLPDNSAAPNAGGATPQGC